MDFSYREIGKVRYEYLIKNIYNKKVYKIFSDCSDACDAMVKEGYNPNDWILLISNTTNC